MCSQSSNKSSKEIHGAIIGIIFGMHRYYLMFIFLPIVAVSLAILFPHETFISVPIYKHFLFSPADAFYIALSSNLSTYMENNLLAQKINRKLKRTHAGHISRTLLLHWAQ